MKMMELWHLTSLIFSPLLGVFLLLFIPQAYKALQRVIVIIATILPLILSSWLWVRFDIDHLGLQIMDWVEWFHIPITPNQNLTFYYSVGVDGLSLLFILLTCFVGVIAVLASWNCIVRKSFFNLLLLLEVAMLGLFSSNSSFLFFVFLQGVYLLTYLMIGLWGGYGKKTVSQQFFLYTGVGSFILLFAMIGLHLLTGTMELDEMSQQVIKMLSTPSSISPESNLLLWSVFLSFAIGFAILLPVFPLHGPMIRIFEVSPFPLMIFYVGILTKIGLYGFFRFVIDLFPMWVEHTEMILWVIGSIQFLFGASMALWQKKITRLLAYASISYIGLMIINISTLNVPGFRTALIFILFHSLIFMLFLYITQSITCRAKSTDFSLLQGLWKTMPVLTTVLIVTEMFFMLASIWGGLELLSVQIYLYLLGLLLTAGYLWRLFTITWGKPLERLHTIKRISFDEWLTLSLLLFLVIGLGINTSSVTEIIQPMLESLGVQYNISL